MFSKRPLRVRKNSLILELDCRLTEFSLIRIIKNIGECYVTVAITLLSNS